MKLIFGKGVKLTQDKIERCKDIIVNLEHFLPKQVNFAAEQQSYETPIGRYYGWLDPEPYIMADAIELLKELLEESTP